MRVRDEAVELASRLQRKCGVTSVERQTFEGRSVINLKAMSNTKPPIKNLILDAAPLLTLFPLRGLASKYIIAPQVLAEIRDKRAREHFETLGLLEGVEVQVRDVDLVSLAKGKSLSVPVYAFALCCLPVFTSQSLRSPNKPVIMPCSHIPICVCSP